MGRGGAIQEYPLKNFAGLNLRDAADKVKENEFTELQNVWSPSKGVFQHRWGTTSDQASFALCSRVSGVWRHYAQNLDKISLYHCIPDTSLIPDNTTDLTLAEVSDGLGNIFGGNLKSTLYVCYSWVGRGMEQTYNSKNRAGFPVAGSFPLDAHSNPGHQTISFASSSSSLRVTVPAFPTGVTAANIFLARGTADSDPCQMSFIGTVTTSGGSLTFREYIGPNAAKADTATFTAAQSAGGSIPAGAYYATVAWICDNNRQEGVYAGGDNLKLFEAQVNVSGKNGSITVTGPTSNSSDGGQALYVFIGTQTCKVLPHTFCGVIRSASNKNVLTITSLPNNNAQTSPSLDSVASAGVFNGTVNDGFVGGVNYKIGSDQTGTKLQARFGFLMRSRNGGAIEEVYPSRSHFFYGFLLNQTGSSAGVVYVGDNNQLAPALGGMDLHNYTPGPRTQNDLYKANADVSYTQPYAWPQTPSDPYFCAQLGLSFFANSADVIWQTDGLVLNQLGRASGTLLPPPGKFVFVFQQKLITGGSLAGSQLYASNSAAPYNWAATGSGSLNNFITIGDATGSGCTASGTFTPTNTAPAGGTTDNPSSWILAMKKIGVWMANTVPNPAAITLAGQIGATSGSMVQVSGQVGCVAARTVIMTPLGTAFLGSDGDVYLVRSVAQPVKIGTRIQNLLTHLPANDTWMSMCTASYHDFHYKLSYPSAYAVTQSPVVNDSELWADLRTAEGESIHWVGPHSGRNIGPQVVLGGDSDDLSRLCADSSAIRTMKADDKTVLTDFGTAVAKQITSKIFRFNNEAHAKRIIGAVLDLFIDGSYTNNVLFECFADADYQSVNKSISTGGATWDVSQWDQSNYADASWQGFSFLFGGTNLTGRTVQFRVSQSNASPFVLASVTLFGKPERRTITN